MVPLRSVLCKVLGKRVTAPSSTLVEYLGKSHELDSEIALGYTCLYSEHKTIVSSR